MIMLVTYKLSFMMASNMFTWMTGLMGCCLAGRAAFQMAGRMASQRADVPADKPDNQTLHLLESLPASKKETLLLRQMASQQGRQLSCRLACLPTRHPASQLASPHVGQQAVHPSGKQASRAASMSDIEPYSQPSSLLAVLPVRQIAALLPGRLACWLAGRFPGEIFSYAPHREDV
jgi:hypothetical protein